MSDTPTEKTAPAKAGPKAPRRRSSDPEQTEMQTGASADGAAKPSSAPTSVVAEPTGTEQLQAEVRTLKTRETEAPKAEPARASSPTASGRPAKPVAAEAGAVRAGAARPLKSRTTKTKTKNTGKRASLRAETRAPVTERPAPASGVEEPASGLGAETPVPVAAEARSTPEAEIEGAATSRKEAKKAAGPAGAARTAAALETAETLAREGLGAAATTAAALIGGYAEINAALFALAGETMARGLSAATALAGCRSYEEAIAVEAEFVKRTAEACASESERIIAISLRTTDAAIAPLNAGVLRATAALGRPFAR